jgi:hypothetical protein
MRTASIKVTRYAPRPPDGLPNFRPNGGHTYQIRDEAGRLRMSGAMGPEAHAAWAWAFRHARGHGFTHYTTPNDPEAREIPAAQ